MANKDQNVHIEFQQKLAPIAGGMAAFASFIVALDIEGLNALVAGFLAGLVSYGIGYISRGMAVLIMIASALIILAMFTAAGV